MSKGKVSKKTVDVLHDHEHFSKKKYANSKELCDRLQLILSDLKGLEQPPDASELPFSEELARSLVDKHYLNHPQRDVQLLVSCIAADVFRLSAPEHPFNEIQLRDIFELWLRQFELLTEAKPSDSTQTYALIFYLLEHTASVKSFIVLTDPAVECDKQTEKLFDLFLNRINPSDLPVTVHRNMDEILKDVLDESESITQDLLDIILDNLCGSARRHNTHGHQLAKSLIHHTHNKLQSTLCTVLDTTLVEQFKQVRKYEELEETNKKRHHMIIISKHMEMLEELALIHPDLLAFFFGPKLIAFMEDESEDLRSKTVETVANIFKRKHSYDRKYPQVYDHFLSRAKDRSKRIRTKMITWCQEVMITVNDEDSKTKLSQLLFSALGDKEEVVRKAAITAIFEVARGNPEKVDMRLVRGLETVCQGDKKVSVRKFCMQKICTLYQELAPLWIESDAPQSRIRDNFRWIPPVVLSFYRAKEEDVRDIVLHLVHSLLPSISRKAKSGTAGDKTGPTTASYARCFLELHRCLPTNAKSNVLQEVLAAKVHLRKLVGEYVDQRSKSKGADHESPEWKQYEKVIASLTGRTGTYQNDWLALGALRDEKIFKCLMSLVDITNPPSMSEAVVLKDQVTSKVRALTRDEALIFFTDKLVGKLIFPVAPEHIDSLVDMAESASRDEDDDGMYTSILLCLNTVLSVFPTLLASSANSTNEIIAFALKEQREGPLRVLLRLLTASADVWNDVLSAGTRTKFLKKVHKLCTEAGPEVRKQAVRLAVAVDADTTDLCQDVVKGLAIGARNTPKLLGTLKALQVLLGSSYPVMKMKSQTSKIISFVQNEVLMFYNDPREMGTEWNALPAECLAWDLGVKVLVAYVLALADANPQACETEGKKIIHFLCNLIKHQNSENVVACVTQAYKVTCVFKGIVSLLSKAPCRKLLQATHLRLLMGTNILENNDQARERMRNVVYKHLRTGQLPMKYTFLLLANVNDPNRRHASIAKEQVASLIEHFRERFRIFEKSCERVALSEPRAPLLCPEYILPDLLYMLAHHPSFDDMYPMYEPIQICFYVFFEAVTKDVDNVSFFYKLLQSLKRHDDALQPHNKNTKVLCDVAFEIVHHEYGKGKNTSGKPFPGTVNLSRLFTPSPGAVADLDKTFKPTEFHLLGKSKALKINTSEPKAHAHSHSPRKEGSKAITGDEEDEALETIKMVMGTKRRSESDVASPTPKKRRVEDSPGRSPGRARSNSRPRGN